MSCINFNCNSDLIRKARKNQSEAKLLKSVHEKIRIERKRENLVIGCRPPLSSEKPYVYNAVS